MTQGVFDFMPQGAPAPAAVFCRRSLPQALRQRRAALTEARAALEKAAALPPVLRVLGAVAWGLAAFFGLVLLAGSRQPAVPLAGLLAGGAAALGLGLWQRRRRAAAQHGPDAASLDAALAALAAEEDAALEVPPGAVEMDILCRAWQPGDEERTAIVQLGDFVNLPVRAFAGPGTLCVVWQGGLYTLPPAPGAALQTVDQKLLLPNWHKATPPHSAAWRQWHLSVGGGGVYARPYHQLPLTNGTVLAVPCYEAEVLRALLDSI